MKLLTRQEEQILLAIVHLGEKAYLVNIREQVKILTGKYLDVGTINKPLKRLHERNLLEASIGDATPTRGGRGKKYYKVTELGFQALRDVRSNNERIWKNVMLPSE